MTRSRIGFAFLLALLALAFAGFVALGIWQVHRLHWKEALIARVDSRVTAPPVPAPPPREWPDVTAGNAEYRHVRLTGHYIRGRDTLVQASTDLGSGFWVLTPFKSDRGFVALVNRGFVPDRESIAAPSGEQQVTGLLRIAEPGGGFLRSNDPAADRWYSRDVAAIAKARGLGRIAPYFIDADRNANDDKGPVGGLTVIRFPNNHLSYAITWFVLAIMTIIGAAVLIRERFRSQKA
ncbi:SURF1 family protein [Stakelama pacifica]|uniref:SURF1-like protein n=1 Tax=Stakelama pacifica TaxID=517720 RepID=A0A4R6FY57_9SPHN|nr:SURF1 family protein [Stakelama pacifica]TDN86913.1 surfeit locus 1 family protein [Stakelama pacifica]GGO91049.1 SURF1-like protein [Stakelama pacifica]